MCTIPQLVSAPLQKNKLTRLLPTEKRSCYMQRFKIKAVLGVLRKNFPLSNE